MKRALPFHSNAVWPPIGLVALFVTAYGMLETGLWAIEHASPYLKGEISSMPEFINIRTGILGTAAAFYALYRLWRFHPFFNLSYSAWLASSPWTPDKPLPLGPIHPVWQDAVVIGVIAAVAQWQAHLDPTLPFIAFGLTYLIAMTLILAFTRTWIACLLLGFIWPAPMLPVMRTLPMRAAILATLIAVIWCGHRQSLRAFPWKRDGASLPNPQRSGRKQSVLDQNINIEIPALSNTHRHAAQYLGWPFMSIAPKLDSDPIPNSTSFLISTLFGWWLFCILGLDWEPGSGSAFSAFVILLFAVFAALIRFAIYCSGLSSSFGLAGRLASGQLIVPGFDQVFVTPLVVIALAIAGGVVIRHAGSWYPIATSCVFALIWFALLSGPPTIRKWLLTGQHRYRSPSQLGANRQLLSRFEAVNKDAQKRQERRK